MVAAGGNLMHGGAKSCWPQLTKAGLDNAWQDLIRAAIEAEVIAPGDRFTLHGLKHRGITDTVGIKEEKKAACGHESEAMLHLYDHEVAIVKPARPGERESNLTETTELKNDVEGRRGSAMLQMFRSRQCGSYMSHDERRMLV